MFISLFLVEIKKISILIVRYIKSFIVSLFKYEAERGLAVTLDTWNVVTRLISVVAHAVLMRLMRIEEPTIGTYGTRIIGSITPIFLSPLGNTT